MVNEMKIEEVQVKWENQQRFCSQQRAPALLCQHSHLSWPGSEVLLSRVLTVGCELTKLSESPTVRSLCSRRFILSKELWFLFCVWVGCDFSTCCFLFSSQRTRRRRVRDPWGNWCDAKDLEGQTFEVTGLTVYVSVHFCVLMSSVLPLLYAFLYIYFHSQIICLDLANKQQSERSRVSLIFKTLIL